MPNPWASAALPCSSLPLMEPFVEEKMDVQSQAACPSQCSLSQLSSSRNSHQQMSWCLGWFLAEISTAQCS